MTFYFLFNEFHEKIIIVSILSWKFHVVSSIIEHVIILWLVAIKSVPLNSRIIKCELACKLSERGKRVNSSLCHSFFNSCMYRLWFIEGTSLLLFIYLNKRDMTNNNYIFQLMETDVIVSIPQLTPFVISVKKCCHRWVNFCNDFCLLMQSEKKFQVCSYKIRPDIIPWISMSCGFLKIIEIIPARFLRHSTLKCSPKNNF